jgi:hypothetical protein
MTDADIIHLVIRMRTAQKEFFRTKDRTYLDVARKLEREVDAALERRRDGQKSFFAPTGALSTEKAKASEGEQN